MYVLADTPSSRAMAKIAQNKWEVSPKSSIHSIAQGITKFKKRIAHLLLNQAPVNLPISSETIVLESEDQDLINDLMELEEIASRQYSRIKQMMDEEQETGLKNPHLNRDIQALTALNKAITKRREWEMVHSGYNPVKQQKLFRQQDQINRQFDGWISTIGDEKRELLIKASQRLMEMLEKKVITLEEDLMVDITPK